MGFPLLAVGPCAPSYPLVCPLGLRCPGQLAGTHGHRGSCAAPCPSRAPWGCQHPRLSGGLQWAGMETPPAQRGHRCPLAPQMLGQGGRTMGQRSCRTHLRSSGYFFSPLLKPPVLSAGWGVPQGQPHSLHHHLQVLFLNFSLAKPPVSSKWRPSRVQTWGAGTGQPLSNFALPVARLKPPPQKARH